MIDVCTTLILLLLTVTHCVKLLAMQVKPSLTFTYHIKEYIHRKPLKLMDRDGYTWTQGQL